MVQFCADDELQLAHVCTGVCLQTECEKKPAQTEENKQRKKETCKDKHYQGNHRTGLC